jgi:hypothetical protein
MLHAFVQRGKGGMDSCVSTYYNPNIDISTNALLGDEEGGEVWESLVF